MEDKYFINQPVFLKYKRRFDWRSLKRKPFIKKALLNERIIEIPFAIDVLAGMPKEISVLDLGCMESVLPLFLAGLGFKVTGFDFRQYPYRVPNFKFVQGSILDCIKTIRRVFVKQRGLITFVKSTTSAGMLCISV